MCHDSSMSTQAYFGLLSVAASTLLLVGCSGPAAESSNPITELSTPTPGPSAPVADQIKVLSEPRSAEDQLPAVFIANENLPLIEDSARLLADYDGVRYYVGRGTNPYDVCLMVYGSPELFHGMCTGGLPFESEAMGLGRAQLIASGGVPLPRPDETQSSGEWVPVTENLIVMK